MVHTVQTHDPARAGAGAGDGAGAGAGAGSSRYEHARSRSISTDERPPTPVSPSRMPTHVQAIHDFDPSLLASTSASRQNMYLSFRTGEVVRVHVRDASGWWDGEISVAVEERVTSGPRRGWFPSNYVREMGWDTTAHKRGEASIASTSASLASTSASIASTSASTTSPKSRKDSMMHSRHTSTTSRASTSTSTSHAHVPSAGPSNVPANARAPNLPPSLQALLHQIVQALSLLESAIHANRITHLQPATACVISCIRSALEQTDCISKESPTLVSHPVLAKERKIVLLELSKLVNCTRAASGVTDEASDPPDPRALETLARSARAVFASVKRFLILAGECGIEASAPNTPVATEADPADSVAMHRTASRTSVGSSRAQETFRLRAASISDLRAARRRQASPPPPMPVSAGVISQSSHARKRSPSRVITPLSASFASSSGSGRSSPTSLRSSHNRRLIGSMDSTFSHASTPSSDVSPWEEPPVLTPMATGAGQLGNVADVHESVGLAEDTLLSIIAAFIGHLHSHHINSHPSSHAYLIEMTRETIDAVRDVLTIVETVGRNAGIRLSRPREIEHLRIAKDLLYDIVSRLVEGAEVVANAPFSEGGEEGYDQEKGRLLQTATGTLRAGTECIRLVKLCLPDDEATLLPAQLATPRQNDGHTRQLTPRPADAAVVFRDQVVGVRGDHTLSGLHRKASSLSYLQTRYQSDGVVQAPQEDDEGDDDEDDDEEVVQDLSREDDVTLRPVVPGTVTFPPTPVRPVLQKIHTTPALGTTHSGDFLRSHSEGAEPVTRSRSSSLSSPALPKVQHRSPSRSADLDKFTGDYPELSNRSSVYSSTFSTATTTTSARSSEMSEFTTLTPQTTHGEEDVLEASHGQGPAAKMAQLSIDTSSIATKSLTLPRPAMSRAFTAPAPQADIRFWVVAHDYDPREISFNSDGNMIGASLAVLVEKMTPHDALVDPAFSATFFATFRLFTTPEKLVQAIIERYNLQPPPSVSLGERERAIWLERKVVPIRLRVYNFLKSWLDLHWNAGTDDIVLEPLRQFASEVVMHTLPAMAPRLVDTVRRRQSGPWSASTDASHKRSSSSDKFRLLSPMAFGSGLPPTPIISKSLHSLLQKGPSAAAVTITDFDTLELARQLTIMESKLFAAVVPEEMLRTGKKTIPELKALSNLSNQITGWVADGILNEQDAKRRASLLKFYIKLADKCLTLNNFSTMFAVLAGLNSSIVLRLKKTWDALNPKYRLLMERLRGVIEHTKNHAAYRARLREVQGPCLPFLGLILTDITFTSDGNPDTRAAVLAPEMQLINYDKYVKLGKIAIEFQRYQQPFNLHELEAVQTFLRRVLAERGSASLDALYRKSLLLEPRQGQEKIGTNFEKPGWLGGRV